MKKKSEDDTTDDRIKNHKLSRADFTIRKLKCIFNSVIKTLTLHLKGKQNAKKRKSRVHNDVHTSCIVFQRVKKKHEMVKKMEYVCKYKCNASHQGSLF